ncbi:MAG: UvrD-helicase domain-containing protein [Lentisphaeria bacterium]|jgi:superfamily I DNA/RNA helicase
MPSAHHLAGLNPQQREAATHLHGPLLILAGAGTGKTSVITRRAAHLLAHGVPPEAILMVTFTNKAAREMRERIAALIGAEPARQLTVATFHGFGSRLLRGGGAARLGYSPRFGLATPSYQAGLVKTLMGEAGAVGEGFDPERFLAAISRAKNALLTPDAMRDQARAPLELKIAAVYAEYQKRLRQMDLMDFDDLLVLILRLWENCPDLLQAHRARYRYLMVDEYQDTNPVQFQIVATLAGTAANLAVVGDDDQSIYGWRGADITNILSFTTHFPAAKVIRLEQNYRSTGAILQAANAVIARNPKRHGKTLWSAQPAGEKITILRVPDDTAEGRIVAEILRDRQAAARRPWTDFAILYRSNHQSRGFEEALRQRQIPYTLVGGRSFFERKEILDGLAMIQAALNPRDDLALLRILNVPPRGIGDKTLETLRQLQQLATGAPLQELLATPEFLAELNPATADQIRRFTATLAHCRGELRQPGNLARAINALFRDLGYLDGLGRLYKPREDALNRHENLMEFITAAAQFEREAGPAATADAFLERFALMDGNDREEKDGQERGVTLMTIHAAKGLEFPEVIVAGLEHNLFPHEMAVKEGNLEEERRLFYVAITRAKERLTLVHCEKRAIRGAPQRRRPSPFLDELPETLVELHTPETVLKPLSREDAKALVLARLRALREE